MILPFYALASIAILLLILISKSHRMMNTVSIAHAAVYFLLTVYAWQFTELPSYYLAGKYFFIDHLGIYEVLIASALFLLAKIFSMEYVEGSIRMGELSRENLKLFYVVFNLLLVSITFSFFSNNLALFWIFAELTTAFSAVLIVSLNAKKNIGAALKYVFITSTSMLFSFIGLLFLFALTERSLGIGTLNWDSLVMYASQLSPKILFASFVFLFVGFAAKAGIVPFHAWLPTAHSKAPAPVSVILSGSVTSVGIYGILRIYAILSQTSALPKVSASLMVFGFLSMAVAAFTLLRQSNLKKLIGYSTIEHTGFMLVGIGIGTPVAIFWVLFHVLAHSFTKALLFFSAGMLHHQYGGVRAEQINNSFRLQPLASVGLMVGSLAIIGMPPLAVFLPKLFILVQAASVSKSMLALALIIFLVAAAAFGIFLTRMLSQTGDVSCTRIVKEYRADFGMKLPIVVLAFIILLLGLYMPGGLSGLLDNIVTELAVGGK